MDETASFDAVLKFDPDLTRDKHHFPKKKYTQIKVQCKRFNKRKKCEHHTLT